MCCSRETEGLRWLHIMAHAYDPSTCETEEEEKYKIEVRQGHIVRSCKTEIKLMLSFEVA